MWRVVCLDDVQGAYFGACLVRVIVDGRSREGRNENCQLLVLIIQYTHCIMSWYYCQFSLLLPSAPSDFTSPHNYAHNWECLDVSAVYALVYLAFKVEYRSLTVLTLYHKLINCIVHYFVSITKHIESANTMLSFIWWILGFYWVTAGGQSLTRDSPQLYWLVGT